MDTRSETRSAHPVILTGCGHVLIEAANQPCDPSPYLKAPKLRKYMGVQDDLAVIAAVKALQSAALQSYAPQRVGLYLVVGYIPFEQRDLDPLLDASLEDGRISMERFSTAGFRAVNGLLTFRCLPNMPAFHISVNCDIQGPYFVTYPGPGQFYLALEEAVHALNEKRIDVALVGGVAHQQNFLVSYHFSRLDPPIAAADLRDAAGCLVLERDSAVKDRGAKPLAKLVDWQFGYQPRFFPHEPDAKFAESFAGMSDANTGYLGPASLPVKLSLAVQQPQPGIRQHVLHSRDGFVCTSTWEW